MSQNSMRHLAEAIAKFNEEHNINGVQIGEFALTNEGLRNATGFKPEDWLDILIQQKARFKRPKGRIIYQPTSYSYQRVKGWNVIQIVVDRYTLSNEPMGATHLSVRDLKKMERVT